MNNDVELTNYVEYRVFQDEAMAALEAIQWAKRKGITSLHMEGDSKNAINVQWAMLSGLLAVLFKTGSLFLF